MNAHRQYRCPGTVAKVNLALNGLPGLPRSAGDPSVALRGRIQIGPVSTISSAPSTRRSYGEIPAAP
jgi:hypothetical protein